MPVTVAHGPASFAAVVKDICKDAVFMSVSHQVPLDAQVTVTFALPGKGGPLEVEGRVVRVAHREEQGGPGIAILFSELTPDERVRLEFFISLQEGAPE